MPEILRYTGNEQLAQAAAGMFAQLAGQAISTRGCFNAALSGGTTPRRMYETLAEPEFRKAIDWSKVHLFWSDERCVPPTDPDSNYRMAKESLLDHLPLPAENIYRMHGELEPQEAARQYQSLLHGHFFPDQEPDASLPPRFDLILLGLGTDGHTASLFPETAALQENSRWVAANYVAKLESWRLTLTLPVLNAVREMIFLVSGAGKADILAQIWQEPAAGEPAAGEPAAYQTLPAALVKPEDGKLLWLVSVQA